ncbi:DVU_1556 family methyltransferase [Aminiphilus circumscriptus]|uniref:DVU_1556 family methyltransferase n=1 Tax=Aminiphilus circumscriptus TaxID=290732 RepID=UPI0004785523|nr:class I SAM-dependent methyltransferase [Aminiphilus circumscriptus]
MSLPYEHPLWRTVMGEAMHPGGRALSLRLLGLCGFSSGTAVLDAGCGGGATLELLQAQGVRAVGLDRSAALLSRAAAKGPVVEGNLRHIPFGEETFEGVICECVLSLQKSLFPVLGEIARVLRRGGRFGVTDLFRRSGQPCGGEGESCAQGARSRKELETALSEHGFALLLFEDHSALLRECTARLVWEGILEPPRQPCRSLGYGLWVFLRKNASGFGDAERQECFSPSTVEQVR